MIHDTVCHRNYYSVQGFSELLTVPCSGCSYIVLEYSSRCTGECASIKISTSPSDDIVKGAARRGHDEASK
jgi:hypothetical protein